MKTVVGLFDEFAQAKNAALELETEGIAHNDVSLVANNEGGRYAPTTNSSTTSTEETGSAIGHDALVGAEIGGVAGLIMGITGLAIPGLGWIAGAGWLMATILGAGTGAVVGGLVGALTNVGVPEEDAANYNEGVRRGGTLVAVKAPDEMANRVAQILEDNGAVDIDQRAAEFSPREGMSPSLSTAPIASVTPIASAPTASVQTNTAGETVLPIVKEELQVGKREVERGGVRVKSYVTEQPVREQVNLREEQVNVERRPVDRPAGETDFNTLREGTFDVRETAEVPVVSKEARVVEEVVINKDVQERQHTVEDTVRSTDVQVENINAQDDKRAA